MSTSQKRGGRGAPFGAPTTLSWSSGLCGPHEAPPQTSDFLQECVMVGSQCSARKAGKGRVLCSPLHQFCICLCPSLQPSAPWALVPLLNFCGPAFLVPRSLPESRPHTLKIPLMSPSELSLGFSQDPTNRDPGLGAQRHPEKVLGVWVHNEAWPPAFYIQTPPHVANQSQVTNTTGTTLWSPSIRRARVIRETINNSAVFCQATQSGAHLQRSPFGS